MVPGWRAARLPDKPYPGLVADGSATAPGKSSPISARRSGRRSFEDPAYTLTAVDLSTGRRALAYVWPDAALRETWTVDSLDADGLAAHLDRVRAWRDRYESATR